MTFEQVIEKIKDPTNLADYREVDELIFWASGWIGDCEEALAEIDQRVSIKYDELAEKYGTDAAGKRKLKLEPLYLEQTTLERKIRRLKSLKSDLKRRYQILTNNF